MDSKFTKLVVDIIRSATSSINGDDFCKHLVISAFGPFGANSAFLVECQADGDLLVFGSFGLSRIANRSVIPLSSKIPVAVAVKSGTALSQTGADWESHCALGLVPSANDLLENLDCLTIPLSSMGLVAGALQINFDSQVAGIVDNPGVHEVLQAAANSLLSGRAHSSQLGHKRPHDESSQDPTERQVGVLAGLAEGLTYFQIARKLLISESTAKQEASKLFRKLQVASRSEAVRVGSTRGLI